MSGRFIFLLWVLGLAVHSATADDRKAYVFADDSVVFGVNAEKPSIVIMESEGEKAGYVGINKATPETPLDIEGTTSTDDLIVRNLAQCGDAAGNYLVAKPDGTIACGRGTSEENSTLDDVKKAAEAAKDAATTVKNVVEAANAAAKFANEAADLANQAANTANQEANFVNQQANAANQALNAFNQLGNIVNGVFVSHSETEAKNAAGGARKSAEQASTSAQQASAFATDAKSAYTRLAALAEGMSKGMSDKKKEIDDAIDQARTKFDSYVISTASMQNEIKALNGRHRELESQIQELADLGVRKEIELSFIRSFGLPENFKKFFPSMTPEYRVFLAGQRENASAIYAGLYGDSKMIVKYDSFGKIIRQWDHKLSWGEPGPEQLHVIYGLAVDKAGNINVSDDKGIAVYNQLGRIIHTYRGPRSVGGLALDDTNQRMYLRDNASTLNVISFKGKHLSVKGNDGLERTAFGREVYDDNGRYIMPQAAAVNHFGEVLIEYGGIIRIYSANGDPLHGLNLSGLIFGYSAASDPDGNFYVSGISEFESSPVKPKKAIYIFDRRARKIGQLSDDERKKAGDPYGSYDSIAVDGLGCVYVHDDKLTRFVKYGDKKVCR